jgi:hypothetical protein
MRLIYDSAAQRDISGASNRPDIPFFCLAAVSLSLGFASLYICSMRLASLL